MRKVILASASPRRKDLLARMGVVFEVVPSDFDEYLDHSVSAEQMTIELGLGKARAVAEKYPGALVIGGDTIVTLDDQHLGKAEHEAHARDMIHAQTGQTVVVTTSVVLVCKALGLEEAYADSTNVVMRPPNSELIEIYLKTGDWTDKAGAWGIQSGAAPLVNHIEGELDTVLGLPTKKLASILRKHGVPAKTVKLKPPVPQKPKG
jgi:septum formation protein